MKPYLTTQSQLISGKAFFHPKYFHFDEIPCASCHQNPSPRNKPCLQNASPRTDIVTKTRKPEQIWSQKYPQPHTTLMHAPHDVINERPLTVEMIIT